MKEKPVNCWEVKGCGREPNGKKASEQGVCPVTTNTSLNGVHEGKNGGRCCWLVKFYHAKQMTGTCETTNCIKCNFYNTVRKQSALLVKP
ncbi:MAG: hypothetical protein D3908_06230 [Candidatus Electrothrix sp. AUS4]|nr:hypothetical protein [Candidatus Electrothrix sp. AUS4]